MPKDQINIVLHFIILCGIQQLPMLQKIWNRYQNSRTQRIFIYCISLTCKNIRQTKQNVMLLRCANLRDQFSRFYISSILNVNTAFTNDSEKVEKVIRVFYV